MTKVKYFDFFINEQINFKLCFFIILYWKNVNGEIKVFTIILCMKWGEISCVGAKEVKCLIFPI